MHPEPSIGQNASEVPRPTLNTTSAVQQFVFLCLKYGSTFELVDHHLNTWYRSQLHSNMKSATAKAGDILSGGLKKGRRKRTIPICG
jgi:predicted transcriptional regulator